MSARPLEIRLSPLAEADLDEIWLYTLQNWSSDQADRYISSIFDAFDHIAAEPQIGKDVGEIRAGYRRLVVGAHFVFYRRRNQALEIVRVLHQRRDLARHL